MKSFLGCIFHFVAIQIILKQFECHLKYRSHFPILNFIFFFKIAFTIARRLCIIIIYTHVWLKDAQLVRVILYFDCFIYDNASDLLLSNLVSYRLCKLNLKSIFCRILVFFHSPHLIPWFYSRTSLWFIGNIFKEIEGSLHVVLVWSRPMLGPLFVELEPFLALAILLDFLKPI